MSKNVSFLLIFAILCFSIVNVHNVFAETCISTNNEKEKIVESKKESFKFQGSIQGSNSFDNNTKLNLSLDGNLEKTKPQMDFNLKKLTIVKNIPFPESKSEIIVKSDGEGIPKIKGITVNEFFYSEKPASSISKEQIFPVLRLTNSTILQEGCKITITDKTITGDLGKYAGSITIFAEGFDSKNIDVEYTSQLHPVLLIFLTGIGIFVAMGLEKYYVKLDVKAKMKKEFNVRIKKINNLNLHISHINSLPISKTMVESTTKFNEEYRKKLLYPNENYKFPSIETIKKMIKILEENIKKGFKR